MSALIHPAEIHDEQAGLEQLRNELRLAHVQRIHALCAIARGRDSYTELHQEEVALLALAMGRQLGIDEARLEGLYLGALVHDIGKVAIPAELLNKPGRLNPEEIALIRTHVRAGVEMLKPLSLPGPVLAIVGQHHERLDGSGYPNGLSGEEILLEARITSVADVFQAMSKARPYRVTGEDRKSVV